MCKCTHAANNQFVCNERYVFGTITSLDTYYDQAELVGGSWRTITDLEGGVSKIDYCDAQQFCGALGAPQTMDPR